MTNGRDFVLDIENFIKKAGENVDKFTREFPQDLAEVVIKETPVLSGFLRANWTASVGVPDMGTYSAGSDPSARIGLNLSRAKAGDTIFITNNTKYGPYVEFGTSKMSPRAMVRKALAQAKTIALETIRRINK